MDNFDFSKTEEISPELTFYATNCPFVSKDKLSPYKEEFVWSEANNLEIPRIDSLHKMMFKTAVLVRLITQGRIEGDHKEGLSFLLDSIKEHFKVESFLMRLNAYPKVKYYGIWYHEFLNWLYAKSYTNGLNKTYEEVLYIEEWIIDHIFDVDFLYAKWLEENRV